MKVWVAYNEDGDLVAEGDNENDLLRELEAAGYDTDDLLIGTVTP